MTSRPLPTKSQALRLLDHLTAHETAESAAIRRQLDIGNIAGAAWRLNAMLAMSGDPRRAVCNHRGRMAIWRLDTAAA